MNHFPNDDAPEPAAPAQEEISDAEIDSVVRMVYGPPSEIPAWLLHGLREFARALLARRAESVRDGALEEAARVCDGVNNHDNPMTALDCAAAIRSLKGKRS